MNDLKFACRQLLGAPGFTIAAVLTLGLGIGANTATFSVVDAALLRSLPYDDPGRLVQVWEASRPGERNWVSAGVFSDWARHSTVFDGLAAVASSERNLTGAGGPERISGLRMSPSGLRILRAQPLVGRVFAPDEDQPGRNRVVVLTHGLWQRRFGGDPGAVGRDVRLNGESHTVIGVLPPAFLPWDEPEFVVPFVPEAAQGQNRGSHWLRVLGRLEPGISAARAREDLLAASQPYRDLYPKWKKDWGVTVVPLHEELTGDVKPILLVLLGAVALVLLIACANVANLLLARASARQKEIAVRMAMGASRARIVRQLLAESLLLALIGAALGLMLAFAGTWAIRHASAADLPRVEEISVNWRVLGFALAASVVTGLLFGLVPALQASRPDLSEALEESGRGSSGGHHGTRSALIVSEVALALVLLAGAGLLIHSFVRLLEVEPGFEPRRALALRLSLPDHRYPDADRRAAVTERLLERIRGLPGVEAAGATIRLPLTGSFDTLVRIPGREGPVDGSHSCDIDYVSAGYFPALRIPLVRGRLFDERDSARKRRVAIVNEAFARTLLPGQDPLGKAIGEGDGQWEIVGVVGDVRLRGLDRPIRPLLYRPLAFAGFPSRNLVVRTRTAPHALIEPIRKAVLAVDADQPIADARSLEDVVAASLARRRLALVVLALFAGSAMLLAAVGLYGVIAYSVSQRTREIGIRMAVGASRRDVLALFVRQGARLAVLGIALGLLAAFGLTRLLASQLYGVGAADPATLASVSAILLAVALAASFLPARRAARIDPVHGLK